MKKLLLIGTLFPLSLIAAPASVPAYPTEAPSAGLAADIVVYGASSAGVPAAVAAAREGKSVVLIEPQPYLGGLLGAGFRMSEDVPFRETLGGIAGWWMDQDRTWKGGNHDWFVNQNRELADKLLAKYPDRITILTLHRVKRVERDGPRITAMILEKATPDEFGVPAAMADNDHEVIVRGKMFIDASYEGDLVAMAKVSYRVGRESRAEFGESLAGVTAVHRFPGISPYKDNGNPASGLLPFISKDPLGELGDASPVVQGYNFKFSWVRRPTPQNPGREMEKPDINSPFYQPVKELFARIKDADYPITWPHYNDERREIFTGTIPGIQAGYPDGDWKTRAFIWREHIEHCRRLTDFSGKEMNLHTTINQVTQGWPSQLYLRVTRRMEGETMLTQKDISLQTEIPDSIGLGFYAVDLHVARLLVLDDGTLAHEGESLILTAPGPWRLPYRMITPQRTDCENLLVPVCYSASHVAQAATRLEAQYMILGESAGVAAAQALDEEKPVQGIDVAKLQQRLLHHGQKIEWDGKGYGRFRTSVANGDNFPHHVLYQWQNHPEEYPNFLPAQRPDVPILVDDSHAERDGDWEELGKNLWFVHNCYLSDRNNGKGTKSVTFKPILRVTGNYEVRISYPPHASHSKKVPVRIRHADGEEVVMVDQTRQPRNGRFDPVGTWRFEANGNASVTVETTGTDDGMVVADAVLFVPKY